MRIKCRLFFFFLLSSFFLKCKGTIVLTFWFNAIEPHRRAQVLGYIGAVVE